MKYAEKHIIKGIDTFRVESKIKYESVEINITDNINGMKLFQLSLKSNNK